MKKNTSEPDPVPPFPFENVPLTQQNRETRRPVCLADIEPEKVNWLWQGYIPFGAVTIIQGDPGVGKGTVTTDIAARVTRGAPMPQSEKHTQPRHILLLSTAEDDLRATLLPRMIAAGADRRLAHAFEEIIEIPQDLSRVYDFIEEMKCALVVFDPLNAYLSGNVDGHKDQDVRRALSPLKIIAEQTGAAIVLVHHLNKAPGGKAIYRGGGSIGITGAARCVLLIEEHPQKPDARVIARVKGNLSAPPPSLEFTMQTEPVYDVPTIKWGGIVNLTANQLLTGGGKETDYTDAVMKAMDFYKRELADGEEHPSEEIEKKREEAGISESTGKRVRKRLSVKSRREGFGANQKWFIRLPKDTPTDTESANNDLSKESDILDTLDTLSDDEDRECLENAESIREVDGLLSDTLFEDILMEVTSDEDEE